MDEQAVGAVSAWMKFLLPASGHSGVCASTEEQHWLAVETVESQPCLKILGC